MSSNTKNSSPQSYFMELMNDHDSDSTVSEVLSGGENEDLDNMQVYEVDGTLHLLSPMSELGVGASLEPPRATPEGTERSPRRSDSDKDSDSSWKPPTERRLSRDGPRSGADGGSSSSCGVVGSGGGGAGRLAEGDGRGEVCVMDEDVPPSLRDKVASTERARRVLRERRVRRERRERGVRRERRRGVGVTDEADKDDCQDAENFVAKELFAGDRGATEFECSPTDTLSGRAEEFQPTNPGPTVHVPRAYDAFRTYWNDDILEHIVRETNRYAMELKSDSERFARDWYDTNVHEVMILFAFWIMISVTRMPTIRSCFSNNILLETKVFRTLMTEARYWNLNKALHFADKAARTADSSKLFLIAPIVEHLNAKFKETYIMGQKVTIVESLLCYKASIAGVDKKDQMLEPMLYLTERKTNRKWYIKVFKRLLNKSIFNSLILVGKSRPKPAFGQAFRLELVEDIIEHHLHRVPQPPVRQGLDRHAGLPPCRLVGRTHYLVRLEVHSGNSEERQSCLWCTVVEKRRRNTAHKCVTCDVPLCLTECYAKFHDMV